MSGPPSPGYVINSDGSEDGADADGWVQHNANPAGSSANQNGSKANRGEGYYIGDENDGDAQAEEQRRIKGAERESKYPALVGGTGGLPKVVGRSTRKWRDPLEDDDDEEEGEEQVEPEQPSRKRARIEDDRNPPDLTVEPPHNDYYQAHPTSHTPNSYPGSTSFPPPNPQQQAFYAPQESQYLPPGAKPHHPRPDLFMPSFFGIAPVDVFQRCIGDWLLKHCMGLANVEIEVKFGTLIEKGTGRRINLPVLTETVLSEQYDCAFRSEMTVYQHATLNKMLNTEVENCSGGRGPHPFLPPHEYYPIRYTHSYLTDTTYLSSNNHKKRITTETKTGRVVECIEKRKVANLDVFCPTEEFDWRISVNTEKRCEPHEYPSQTDRVEVVRQKDRVTYQHNVFQIDLTQVKQPEPDGGTKVLHELEVEMTNAASLLTQGWLESQGQPNSWEAQMACLLNTVRMLNRNAGPKIDPSKRLGPR